jgi:hypothetical protein
MEGVAAGRGVETDMTWGKRKKERRSEGMYIGELRARLFCRHVQFCTCKSQDSGSTLLSVTNSYFFTQDKIFVEYTKG